MAKAAKKAEEVSWCEVAPLGRRRLDPYNSRYVGLDSTYILDSKKAQALADMGEIEIVAEDVPSPWAPKAPTQTVPSTKPAEAPKEK